MVGRLFAAAAMLLSAVCGGVYVFWHQPHWPFFATAVVVTAGMAVWFKRSWRAFVSLWRREPIDDTAWLSFAALMVLFAAVVMRLAYSVWASLTAALSLNFEVWSQYKFDRTTLLVVLFLAACFAIGKRQMRQYHQRYFPEAREEGDDDHDDLKKTMGFPGHSVG